MRTLYAVFLFILALGLATCAAQPTSELPFESPLTTSPVATVAAGVLVDPTPLPNPQAGRGNARLRLLDHESGQPLSNRIFFLGEVSTLQAQDGGEDVPFITVMPQSSPNASTDQDGYVAFLDIEPKTYAVVFWTPISSTVLTDTSTQKEIFVEIKAGESIDLGTISVSNVP
jgi:hypothetical protein